MRALPCSCTPWCSSMLPIHGPAFYPILLFPFAYICLISPVSSCSYFILHFIICLLRNFHMRLAFIILTLPSAASFLRILFSLLSFIFLMIVSELFDCSISLHKIIYTSFAALYPFVEIPLLDKNYFIYLL